MGDTLIPMGIGIDGVLLIQRRQGTGGPVPLLKDRWLGAGDGNRAYERPCGK
ncbi:MAG: hypothetical protein AABZ34_16020 [Nitrospirota bacterium]